jgi:hypothetical protein
MKTLSSLVHSSNGAVIHIKNVTNSMNVSPS